MRRNTKTLLVVVALVSLALLIVFQREGLRRWFVSRQQVLSSDLSVRIEDLYLFPTAEGDLLRVRLRFLSENITNAKIGLVTVGVSGSEKQSDEHWWVGMPEDGKGGLPMILELRDTPAYHQGFLVRFYEPGQPASIGSKHTDVRVRYWPRRKQHGEV